MDRDRLRAYLERGLSLTQIGALENRDPSTVGYWVQKHGLVANRREKHAARGRLPRERLEALVEEGLTIAEIATAVVRSTATVRYWLNAYGLKTKSRRGRRSLVSRQAVQRAILAGSKTLTAVCPSHGPGTFVIEGSGRARCRRCRMERVAERRRKVKRMLIEEAGGQCVRCGYRKFVGALHFHHVDSSQKSFGVSQKGATIAVETLRAEAAKCVVLCANCHAEVEGGVGSLPDHIVPLR